MFVALVQQGMVSDQKVAAVLEDEAAAHKAAENEAKYLNDHQEGFGEAYTAVVLKVPDPGPAA